jgi:hypothetical protein
LQLSGWKGQTAGAERGPAPHGHVTVPAGNASGTVHSGVVARTTREAGERGVIACQHVLSGFAEA